MTLRSVTSIYTHTVPSHPGFYVPRSCLGHSALISQLKSWCQEIRHHGSRSKNASILRLHKLSPALKEQETAEHLGVMPHTPLSWKPLRGCLRERTCVCKLPVTAAPQQSHCTLLHSRENNRLWTPRHITTPTLNLVTSRMDTGKPRSLEIKDSAQNRALRQKV